MPRMRILNQHTSTAAGVATPLALGVRRDAFGRSKEVASAIDQGMVSRKFEY